MLRRTDSSRRIDRVNVLVGGAFATLFVVLLLQASLEAGTDVARFASLPFVAITVAIAALLTLELAAAIGRLTSDR
ncbi:hypothetical protein [Rhodoplanes sp. SY1]|uniref:hypothetical protein n=1 Tax=Rhodoplanes sp. SY1 TaxID=3166646 RepID=UPI0038B52D5C